VNDFLAVNQRAKPKVALSLHERIAKCSTNRDRFLSNIPRFEISSNMRTQNALVSALDIADKELADWRRGDPLVEREGYFGRAERFFMPSSVGGAN
jgi:hypothetical protein